MAYLPSGIGIIRPGTLPAGSTLPANIKLPPGGYGLLPGMPGAGAGPASGPAPAAQPKTSPISYAPFDVTPQLLQTYGIGNAFNPMTIFDLMNLGMGPFVSPFAGSGLMGYPGTLPGAGLSGGAGLSAPAGPAVSGTLASAPLPQSGGKGAMMG
jgi:hypothetical protein